MIVIRALEARDKPEWQALFKAYIEFYKASIGNEVVEATWQRLISADPDFHICLVAVDDADKPVGIAHVLFHPSTWSPTCYCYLEDLFVEPSARRKGIGRALIDATYSAADAKGCTRTYWTTQEFNYRARTLYDQVATKMPFIRYQR